MTDQQLWTAAVASIKKEFDLLPPQLKLRIGELTAEIRNLKAGYQELAATADAEAECAACLGGCCGHGKHHFTVVDLLGYLTAGADLFVPLFNSHLCPYHNGSGCMMAPDLRPFNCIIFLCEDLESALGFEALEQLARIEKELRRLYYCIEALLGNRFENGLLITFERSLKSGGVFFNYK